MQRVLLREIVIEVNRREVFVAGLRTVEVVKSAVSIDRTVGDREEREIGRNRGIDGQLLHTSSSCRGNCAARADQAVLVLRRAGGGLGAGQIGRGARAARGET